MASQPNNQGNAIGNIDVSTTWGDFNNHMFVIMQAISKIQTATLVKIVSVTNSGGLSPVGYVDVLPLVDQIDNAGSPTPHSVIYNIPYMRLQGGANAIILDPQVGDIGVCIFASRDISQVKKTKKQSSPATRRKFSYADGLYIGGFLNGTPTQYIQFSTSGIVVKSPTKIRFDAPEIDIHASTKIKVDVNGRGWIYNPTNTDNYTIGSTADTNNNISPPEIP